MNTDIDTCLSNLDNGNPNDPKDGCDSMVLERLGYELGAGH